MEEIIRAAFFPLPLFIKSKDVKVRDLVPEMWQAIAAYAHVLHDMGGTHVVITSANDGRHMQNSYHYDNRAVDLRIWEITESAQAEDGSWQLVHTDRTYRARDQLRERLGDEYDVLLKPTHIHVEPSPRAPWGAR